ncbi:MAG: hypothetical protein LC776_15625 [Acidobacteria bacterium]|nr:hypothetical protein [Acidobacteriota bacterium]
MMAMILVGLVAALGILVLVLLSAQVEMYRNLEQLRVQTGMIDRGAPVDLGKAQGRMPSSFGLPADLDRELSALILFLSDKCLVCRSIVAAFDGNVPPGVFIVIDPGTASRDMKFTAAFAVDESNMLVDWETAVFRRVGIKTTPTGVVVENGRLARAVTLPSTRDFFSLLGSVKSISADGGAAAPSERERL